jgi:hypothetical protein
MLWILFSLLLVLWFLGVVTAHTLGGMLHLLLVLALLALLTELGLRYRREHGG